MLNKKLLKYVEDMPSKIQSFAFSSLFNFVGGNSWGFSWLSEQQSWLIFGLV